MSRITTCPNSQTLNLLAQGQIAGPESEALLEHVEQCSGCAGALKDLLASDTLVDAVKAKETVKDKSDQAAVNNLVAKVRAMVPPGKQPGLDRTLDSVQQPSFSVSSDTQGVDDDSASDEEKDNLGPPQAEDELGRLGNYRVLKVLGVGGMGKVYLAEDLQLKRKVALKVMKPSLARNPKARQRFLQEAQTAAAIEHDNIVAIYQVGEDRRVPFLAMPLLTGISLDDYLKKYGVVKIAPLVKLGIQIAEGLAAAHQRGLIHRDIKPGNIWIEPVGGGRAKILDFGLARSASVDSGLTQTGAIVGTPAYMPPEQARGEKVDHRCDLYSLGCVLYRMATGNIPIKGNDTMALLMALALNVPDAPRKSNPNIPEVLDQLIMQLLAKDPKDRPESAKLVVNALRMIERDLARSQKEGEAAPVVPQASLVNVPVARLAGMDKTVMDHQASAAPGAGTNIPVSAPKAAPPKRRWLVLAAGGLAAALLLLAGIVFFLPAGDGVIRVEVFDNSIKVAIDQGELKIIGADKKEYSVAQGLHGLKIKHGDIELETEKFTLRKGETVALKIEFLQGKLQVAMADGKVIAEKWVVGSGDPIPAGGPVETRLRGGIERFHVSTDGRRLFAYFPFESKVAIFDTATLKMIFEFGGLETPYITPRPDLLMLAYAHDHAGVHFIPTTGPDASRKTQVCPSRVAEGSVVNWNSTGSAFCFFTDGLRLFNPDGSRTIELGKVQGNRFSWSPDGQWLAGFVDKQFRFWKADGTPGPSFDAPAAYPYSGMNSVQWSPDSKLIALADQQLTILGPEMKEAKVLNHKLGDAATIVRLRPDSKALLLTNRNANMGILTLANETLMPVPIAVDRNRGPENLMGFAPSGKDVVVCRGDEMHFLEVAEKVRPQRVLPIRHMTQFAFMPDGKEMIISYRYPGAEGILRFFDLEGKPRRILRGPLLTPEKAIDLPPVLATSAYDKLDRKNIAADELKVAGNGDAKLAPRELVAILGESTFRVGQTVRSLQFSSDGKQVAVGGGNRLVRMEVASGRLVGDLGQPPIGASNALTLDWTKLAQGRDLGGNGQLIVWDAKTGLKLFDLGLRGAGLPVFSPDGSKVVVGPFGQPVQLFDATSGTPLWQTKNPGSPVGFAADGKEIVALVTSENAQSVKVLDSANGRELRQLPAPHVYSRLLLSPDGQRIAYAQGDAVGKIRIFETATGKPICTLEEAEERTPGAISADNSIIALAQSYSIRLSDAKTGKTIRHCKLSAGCTHIAFSPDGKTLAGGDADGWIRFWEVATGELKNQSTLHAGPVQVVALRPEGTGIITIGAEGTLIEWDAATAKMTDKTNLGRQLLSGAVAGSGQKAALQAEGDLVIWDLVEPSRRLIRIHQGVIGLNQRVRTMDGEGNSVAYAGHVDGLFHLVKPKFLPTADGNDRAAAVFAPGGASLLYAGEDRWHQQQPSLSLVDVKSGQRLAALPEPGGFLDAAFHPAGNFFAVAAAEPTNESIRLFDLQTGSAIRSITGLHANARLLAWRGDGKWLASLSKDGALLVHDLTGAKETIVREIPLGQISQVIRRIAFTPDGRHLATTNANGTVFVLRLAEVK